MLALGMIPGFFSPGLRPPFGGPNIQPRPIVPAAMRMHSMFRPRPRIVYNQLYRPRMLPSATVTSNSAAASSTSNVASSSGNVTSTSNDHKDPSQGVNNNSTKEEDK